MDQAIHRWVMQGPETGNCPKYSEDPQSADLVRKRLRAEYRLSVVTGRTGISKKPWFARYEGRTITDTEVIAETLPLAICRLALVRAVRDEKP